MSIFDPYEYAASCNRDAIRRHNNLAIITACLNEIGVRAEMMRDITRKVYYTLAEIVIDGKETYYLNYDDGILTLFDDTCVVAGSHTIAEIPLADPKCFEKIRDLTQRNIDMMKK